VTFSARRPAVKQIKALRLLKQGRDQLSVSVTRSRDLLE
jgi:hypothetical protein